MVRWLCRKKGEVAQTLPLKGRRGANVEGSRKKRRGERGGGGEAAGEEGRGQAEEKGGGYDVAA